MPIKINGEYKNFLYEDIQKTREMLSGQISFESIGGSLDDEIIQGLNPNKSLRSYQKEAMENTEFYIKNNLTKLFESKKNLKLLYYMATGSGKTLMMAYLILYFYKKGYNTFLFFVNNNNIVEKTKDNFLHKDSSKYLFNDKIILNGKNVKVNAIDTFQEIQEDKINIMFTTVQTLYERLKVTREDQITLEDFQNHKLILLADEAHHINAETKKGTGDKKDKKELESWEGAINQILNSNYETMLLEFTATPDFKNENIVKEYLDKVIYNYDLLSFRKDGYTKDFDNYESENDDIHRLLLALLFSQYRKKMFAKNKINAKPVVLAKAKTNDERKEFEKRYLDFLEKEINVDDIAGLEKNADGYAKEMFKFFKEENISHRNLIEELKIEFDQEHIIELDSTMPANILSEKNRKVNQLEEKNNPYRLIFVTDMLNEGWDVLNLYDIVRLYETRDTGRSKIGKATTQEAQLIGRGVRYYPFAISKEHENIENKRKYDDDCNNPLRICEKLLFHSKTDSKYLSELKQALREQGMDIDDKIKFEYKLKEKYRNSPEFNETFLFINEQQMISKIKECVPDNFKFIHTANFVKGDKISSLVEDTEINTIHTKEYTTNTNIKKLAMENYAIVYKAFRESFLDFNDIKVHLPKLKSIKEFLLGDKYIGDFEFSITSEHERPTNKEYYLTLKRLFSKLSKEFYSWKDQYEGTKRFRRVMLKDYIKDTKREKISTDKNGEGISQNDPRISEEYKLDLSDKDWYVYEDNFGTTEEKLFVKYFAEIVPQIQEEYEKVYLLRNERNMHIYSFKEGRKI